MAASDSKPWDSRLACFLVEPLRRSALTPNHLTTAGLVLGVSAGMLFAQGDREAANWGALLYVLAALMDHADGELARLAGKTSRFGYYYDQMCGAMNYVALFAGMVMGLQKGPMGNSAVIAGVVAGSAIALTLALRFEMENHSGKPSTHQPGFAGFEIEDAMYLIGPITWIGALSAFIKAAAIGAPVFAAWQVWQYLKWKRSLASGPVHKQAPPSPPREWVRERGNNISPPILTFPRQRGRNFRSFRVFVRCSSWPKNICISPAPKRNVHPGSRRVRRETHCARRSRR